MRIDPLQQYARIKQQLTEEKNRLEARLNKINQVLGRDAPSATSAAVPLQTRTPLSSPTGSGHGRGQNRFSLREVITQALSQRGPLGRKELGQAVVDLGYRSKAKNVLGSIGNLLYGKNSPFLSREGKFYLAGATAAAAAPSVGAGPGAVPARRKRRGMSAEGRARIAAAQRARRARERAGK